MENYVLSMRLSEVSEIILCYLKPLKLRGLIVTAANITLIHRLGNIYLFNYR